MIDPRSGLNVFLMQCVKCIFSNDPYTTLIIKHFVFYICILISLSRNKMELQHTVYLMESRSVQ